MGHSGLTCTLLTGHFDHIVGVKAHLLDHGERLLRGQRLGGRQEDNLAHREPAVEVVHDHPGDKRLSQPCGLGGKKSMVSNPRP